jgi:hypothetical protein
VRGLTAVSSSREIASLGSDAACTADTATARYVAKYDNLMMLCVVYVTSYKETPDVERGRPIYSRRKETRSCYRW